MAQAMLASPSAACRLAASSGQGVATGRTVERPVVCCFSAAQQSKSGLQFASARQASLLGSSTRFVGDATVLCAPAALVSKAGLTMAAKAAIQFIRGVNEAVVPDVKLTRSRDGSTGTATFLFEQPTVFESASELGEITGLFLVDEEGVLQSVDVSAKFLNGKPANIEAKYVMRSPKDWDRFMRFMERYAEENNLGFSKK